MKHFIKTWPFWKSVLTLDLAFMFVFFIIKWIIEGFSTEFVTGTGLVKFLLWSAGAGFVYGFFVSYGKFLKQYREGK